jgi:hypothetical protein
MPGQGRRRIPRRIAIVTACVCRSPIFSGEWTLNCESSSLSPVVAPVVEGGFVTIAHREPTVSVHLSITMAGKPVDVRFERPSEWNGEALVFADSIPTPNSEMTIVFCYDATISQCPSATLRKGASGRRWRKATLRTCRAPASR